MFPLCTVWYMMSFLWFLSFELVSLYLHPTQYIYFYDATCTTESESIITPLFLFRKGMSIASGSKICSIKVKSETFHEFGSTGNSHDHYVSLTAGDFFFNPPTNSLSVCADTQPKIVEALLGYELVQVSCGASHVLAVTNEREVFAWGRGDNGKLQFFFIFFFPLSKHTIFSDLPSRYLPLD